MIAHEKGVGGGGGGRTKKPTNQTNKKHTYTPVDKKSQVEKQHQFVNKKVARGENLIKTPN